MTTSPFSSDSISKPERVTQNRIVKLFCEQLGYRLSRQSGRQAGQQQHRSAAIDALPDRQKLQSKPDQQGIG
jgi:hypothetical protein